MNYSQKKEMNNMISDSKIDALIYEQDKMMEDKFKYRNEIEALSRLRNYKVDDLYNTTINSEVDINIRKIYNPDDVVHTVSSDSISHSDANLESNNISWDTYLKGTLDSYDHVEDKVTFLLNVIQLCTSLLKSFWV